MVSIQLASILVETIAENLSKEHEFSGPSAAAARHTNPPRAHSKTVKTCEARCLCTAVQMQAWAVRTAAGDRYEDAVRMVARRQAVRTALLGHRLGLKEDLDESVDDIYTVD